MANAEQLRDLDDACPLGKLDTSALLQLLRDAGTTQDLPLALALAPSRC
jgi:hypothetical protein